jgi:hypothetical protein
MRSSQAGVRTRLAVVVLLAAPAALPAAGVPAAPPPAAAAAELPGRLAGLPLAEALRRLQQAGLTLVFSDELVTPGMSVEAEPAARRPRRVLDEVLAPHGLAVQAAPGGLLVVVRAPAEGREEGAVAGLVRARGVGEGLAGAVVRVVPAGPGAAARQAAVDAGGRFAFTALVPGEYAVEAAAAGFLEQRVDAVEVAAGAVRRVHFELLPRPFVAEEIVVRPSRLALFHERPDSPLELGRGDVEAVPHLGDDVVRSVSLLPGTAGDDVSARFSVHGGRRDEVQVVLDGQELYQGFHLPDYDGALSLVPARTLGGVSLATGAWPVSRGDRMGGVLELRTRDPDEERRLLIGLGVLDAVAAGSGRFASGGWLASARRGSLDLAHDAVGDEEPSFWDVLGKLELDAAGGLFTAHLLAAGDRLTVDTREEEDFERLSNDYRSTYAWLGHQWLPADRLVVDGHASWSGIDGRRSSDAREEQGSYGLRDRRRLEVLALAQELSFQASPRRLWRGGWQARRYEADFDYAKDLELDVVILAPFSPPRESGHAFDGTVTGDHLGAWASHRATHGRLTAELGLRWDRHTASDDTVTSPRLNLAWRLGERSVVRAAWGRFAQSQRPYELQVEDGETRLWPAERSRQWVLGWEALPERAAAGAARLDAVRLELFHRRVANPRPRYENLLEPLNFFPEIEPDRVRLDPESGTARGVELLLRGRWGSRLDGWLAWSWARAEERLGGRTVPRRLDQPHALSLALAWRLPRRWDLALAWRFHSGWPTTPVFPLPDGGEEPEEDGEDGMDGGEDDGPAAPVAVFGPLNSRRLPDYHRLDLRFSRRWQRSWGGVLLYLDVQNVYDRENASGFDVSFDDEEGLVVEDETWPGLFPSVGVVLEL